MLRFGWTFSGFEFSLVNPVQIFIIFRSNSVRFLSSFIFRIRFFFGFGSGLKLPGKNYLIVSEFPKNRVKTTQIFFNNGFGSRSDMY